MRGSASGRQQLLRGAGWLQSCN